MFSRFSLFVAAALLALISIAHGAPIDLEARRASSSSRITYYSGSQLNNPACGGPTPGRNAMIAAVKQGGRFKCGDRLHIKSKDRHVTVRVVDYCPGCTDSGADLTPGAFSKLASLEQGVINGAQMWVE